MRHGRKLKNIKGEIVHCTFLCNRQGFRDKREHKAVTRCRCPAEFRIKPKVETSRWFISLNWILHQYP
ncbi:hypothetical protein PIB30_095248 [Stylosanthes scabra]|uniref:Uncharacterized protein n=1 Tax=Stylosanthes scabra TaxID=79078 RepID=A0ABU6TY54_9FABA|nr:hypothetical protein [Stylosanthes scabra]